MQVCGVLFPLIKSLQIHAIEPLSFVKRSGLNSVVVNPEAFVRVSDGHIQSKVVIERVVGSGEFKLGKLSIIGVKFNLIRTEN